MTEEELLDKVDTITGLTLKQISSMVNYTTPPINSASRKGWAGQLIEKALGATGGSRAVPDFENLNIELKTIPIDAKGLPVESTFVTSISLLTIRHETWETSQCFSKLKRVLWIPIEADKSIYFDHRRVGKAIIWSPSADDEAALRNDWQELTNLIVLGRVAEINARQGQYLQVRPKALNSQVLCDGIDEEGKRIKTLPRGFYLRRLFTKRILNISKNKVDVV